LKARRQLFSFRLKDFGQFGSIFGQRLLLHSLGFRFFLWLLFGAFDCIVGSVLLALLACKVLLELVLHDEALEVFILGIFNDRTLWHLFGAHQSF